MEELKVFKDYCKKYNYTCEDFFGYIKIKSKFETWRVKTTNGGKTCLYHQNMTGKTRRHVKNDYHIEFCEYITPQEIVQYIYEHESGKYSRMKFDYSVVVESKRKKYKKALIGEIKRCYM